MRRFHGEVQSVFKGEVGLVNWTVGGGGIYLKSPPPPPSSSMASPLLTLVNCWNFKYLPYKIMIVKTL